MQDNSTRPDDPGEPHGLSLDNNTIATIVFGILGLCVAVGVWWFQPHRIFGGIGHTFQRIWNRCVCWVPRSVCQNTRGGIQSHGEAYPDPEAAIPERIEESNGVADQRSVINLAPEQPIDGNLSELP